MLVALGRWVLPPEDPRREPSPLLNYRIRHCARSGRSESRGGWDARDGSSFLLLSVPERRDHHPEI